MASQKIMIIDDDPVTIKILKKNFADQGYEVVTTDDGQDAFRNVKLVWPTILIVDVMLPSLSGYELVKKIRSLETEIKNVPVIVMSAKESMQMVFEPLQILRFFPKPVDTEALNELVHEVIGEAKSDGVDQLPNQDEAWQGSGTTGPTARYVSSKANDPATARYEEEITDSDTSAKTIVIGGENEEILEMIELFLSKRRYQLHVAKSQKELDALVKEFLPELVLMEFSLESKAFQPLAFYKSLKMGHATLNVSFIGYCQEGVQYWKQSLIPISRILTYPKEGEKHLLSKIEDYLTQFNKKKKES